MLWFRKDRRTEIWDENIQWPIGDIEAAQKIRDICHFAADSAEKVNRFADRAAKTNNAYDTERYERAVKTAMEVAFKMSDDLMRDSAVRQIVGLCMKANSLKTAQILVRGIQAVSIREDVFNDHPILRK